MSERHHDRILSCPIRIRAEIQRALMLSASLNNPADHEIVAEYIAELEGAPTGLRGPSEREGGGEELLPA